VNNTSDKLYRWIFGVSLALFILASAGFMIKGWMYPRRQPQIEQSGPFLLYAFTIPMTLSLIIGVFGVKRFPMSLTWILPAVPMVVVSWFFNVFR
jgi:hypothetical protein